MPSLPYTFSLRWSRDTILSFNNDYNPFINIRRLNVQSYLKVAGNSLMGHYNHSIWVDAKIMVSKTCPIIGEQVAVNFVAQ